MSETRAKRAQTHQICPECGSTSFQEDITKGEVICNKCGMVLEESMIDLTQDWRAFDEQQRSSRARTGAPLTATKHDKGVTTEIGKGIGELFKLSSKKRAQYYRLRKWQKRLVESKDRNLSFALSELQRLVSYLGLSQKVHEEVAKLYEKAVDKGLVRGRSMESIIAALIYTVCRETKSPRSLDEIVEASGVERREIGRTYRYVCRELGIRILPSKPEDFIPRFTTMLGLDDKIQMRAIETLREASKFDITSGKGPRGVAAAALYIAAVLQGEKRTQREVADIVGVTEVTIRNRYKEIVEALDIEEKVERKAMEGEEEGDKNVSKKLK